MVKKNKGFIKKFNKIIRGVKMNDLQLMIYYAKQTSIIQYIAIICGAIAFFPLLSIVMLALS
jgi:hypothetical protein